MKISTLLWTRFEHIRNGRLSREALDDKRLKKFRRLVQHVQRHSPYYAKVIREKGIDPRQCRPEDFPILTKTEVMANFDRIVTDRRITKSEVLQFLAHSKDPIDLFKSRFHVIHTSGSSGEKGIFVYSEKDWARGMAHALRMHKYSFRKKRIAFIGSTQGHFGGVSFVTTGRRFVNKWFFTIETYEINRPVASFIDRLNAFQPDVLAGYTTALEIFAEKQLQGTLNIHPSVVESSGEPVNPTDRAVIEAAFSAPLINMYMSSEHIYMGIARPEDDGMVLLEDDLIFEIHDDHTCVTNLFNTTMPLIRYRMEDVLIPEPDTDGVLPYTKVRDIVGRNEHVPFFRNKYGVEDFINPHVISGFIAERLKRFQIELVDKTSFIFKACPNGKLDDAERSDMLQSIRQRMTHRLSQKDMENVSFDIHVVDDLPVDQETGKFKLILAPGERFREDVLASKPEVSSWEKTLRMHGLGFLYDGHNQRGNRACTVGKG